MPESMNPEPSSGDAPPRRTRPAWLWPALAFLAVGGMAVSSQSFWIDEACTTWKARQPTLAAWWQEMKAMSGSDLQMPLYMVYVWGWHKIFGHGEWWMRAANIPWFLMGVLTFARRRLDLLLAAALSPFAWYCLDEARPYGMQIGASALIVGALLRLYQGGLAPARPSERWWAWGLSFGLIALSGSSLLGMIWAGAAVGATLLSFPWPRQRALLRAHPGPGLAAAVCCLSLAAYYLWTLKTGAGASTAATTDARSALFVTFELLGFSGLGPGRLDIRGGGLEAFRAHLAPLLVYALVIVGVLAAGLARLKRSAPFKVLMICAAVVGGVSAFLLVAGSVKHFRVLGRHFAPALPVVLLCVGTGLRSLWERGSLGSRTWASGFVVLSLASCLSLRWAGRHAKDDYRAAAALATNALAAGEVVWWAADPAAGRFYGVPVPSEPVLAPPAGQAVRIYSDTRQWLDQAPKPDLVLFSKPDLYDAQGSLAGYLTQGGYRRVRQLPAFTVWRRASR